MLPDVIAIEARRATRCEAARASIDAVAMFGDEKNQRLAKLRGHPLQLVVTRLARTLEQPEI